MNFFNVAFLLFQLILLFFFSFQSILFGIIRGKVKLCHK
jgi:hypothetical protein